jgi:hypothetical protein
MAQEVLRLDPDRGDASGVDLEEEGRVWSVGHGWGWASLPTGACGSSMAAEAASICKGRDRPTPVGLPSTPLSRGHFDTVPAKAINQEASSAAKDIARIEVQYKEEYTPMPGLRTLYDCAIYA